MEGNNEKMDLKHFMQDITSLDFRYTYLPIRHNVFDFTGIFYAVSVFKSTKSNLLYFVMEYKNDEFYKFVTVNLFRALN